MSETVEDQWRVMYQVLPLNLHERFKAQMRRVAIANGIAAEYFDGDSKFSHAVGPRVQAWECLLILMERSGDDAFRV